MLVERRKQVVGIGYRWVGNLVDSGGLMAQMAGALVRAVQGVVFLLEEREAEDIFPDNLLRIGSCRVSAGAAEVI